MDKMSDMIEAVTAAGNDATSAPAPAPVASSQSREQSEATAVTVSSPSQQVPVTNDDSDARKCVICTEDVDEDDVCWVETFCGLRRHIYHHDCIAFWWIEKEWRHCPRCTQDVMTFMVHARSATGEALQRTFAAGPCDEGSLDELLVIVSQSFELEGALPIHLSADYGWPRRVWTARGALCDWLVYLWRRRSEEVAVAGMERLHAIETAWEPLEPLALDGAWAYIVPTANGGRGFLDEDPEEDREEERAELSVEPDDSQDSQQGAQQERPGVGEYSRCPSSF